MKRSSRKTVGPALFTRIPLVFDILSASSNLEFGDSAEVELLIRAFHYFKVNILMPLLFFKTLVISIKNFDFCIPSNRPLEMGSENHRNPMVRRPKGTLLFDIHGIHIQGKKRVPSSSSTKMQKYSKEATFQNSEKTERNGFH